MMIDGLLRGEVGDLVGLRVRLFLFLFLALLPLLCFGPASLCFPTFQDTPTDDV